ncbi:tetratricopeptide repeat protein [Psychroserpens sp.]|uniref:tetratricopeptide repeat protein n=1 Tax=Psychroserpens sp. TaxID=2020870 RepID=UPI001B06013A|nr:tetratricopeptide repeat protein [Psychroserpens sp.]MBO6606419.1 tetratricopeptide repeat protein [Psychroserpens sp.]MBO6631219.1 tetratricopeptide repeat protein [Psychroserpens sp.]MBO6653123.1 tetratricopeptide repeat protein [Psychroserpens sp.]MBO6680849.1 tetratricopeptide repeat protein [Psychroserpens sp.]MBO6750193.1 tetratricopeptide repeat protein [Psychroserpens sp.]
MRYLLVFAMLFVSSIVIAQDQLSTEAWQEDLDFLQSTIHKNYPFLFKKIESADFDREVAELKNAIPSLEAHEIPVHFARIVSLFEYGHTTIPFGTVAKRGVLPINLYDFNDGVYIEGVQKAHAETLGAKVLKVGEFSIEKAMAMVRPVVPAENDQYFRAYGLKFVTVPDVLHTQRVISEVSEAVTLTLEKGGNVFTYDFPIIDRSEVSTAYTYTVPNETWVSIRNQDETPYYLKHLLDKRFYFEYLEDKKVVYVRQSSVFDDENETLADFYKRLFDFIDSNEVERLVYDVRLNGGGNNYNNKPLIKGLMARPNINAKGKFFFIIGRNTFSACQNLTNEIHNYTEAIIIGEPTAENVNFYGDNNRVTLPNSKINAYLSFAWWQDKPQWENADYTIPHFAVDMSFDEYRNNEDPVLETALTYENHGFILDPMAHLTQLFTEGKIEQLKTDAAEIVQNPQYRYYDFEEEFSKAGNRLLGAGNPEAQQSGLFVLQLVAELFPKSAKALYNLAYAQELNEQIAQAISSYEKVIRLDPESNLAIASTNRIKALKE